jgi:signal transduction histidine kinase
MEKSDFLRSIRGKIALANLASVSVLVVIGVVATWQFRELGRLVGVVSDGAQVLMRLHHALDERDRLVESFRKGYAGKAPNADAQAHFSALASDLEEHARKVQPRLGSAENATLVARAADDLGAARTRSQGLDKLSEDEREVALIELEESLGDAMGRLAQVNLGEGRDFEQRLETVKSELTKPERLFWLAAAAGGVVALAISVFLQRRVSKPIEVLGDAVGALARGEPRPIESLGEDEIGRLAVAFNDMAQTITERNRSLKLVLDSVGDGLVTCNALGELLGEPSKNARDWFGAPAPGQKIWQYLAGDDSNMELTLELGIGQLFEDLLPFEASLGQMPSLLSRGARMYALGYRQVLIEGKFERLLVVLSDVTEHFAMRRKEQEQRDLFTLTSSAMRDPDSYLDFCADTSKRLANALTGNDVMIELHTVKGNAGVMGCEYFASRVHDVESIAAEGGDAADAIKGLETHFQALLASCEATLGRTQREAIVVPRDDYDRLRRLLVENRIDDAIELVSAWTMQRLESVLDRLSVNATRYAERAGKQIQVEVDSGGIAVPRGHLDELWNCLVHLVKNTVAHGIEEQDRRVAAGKPAEGKIRLAVAVHNEQLKVSVRDDGAGIDWSTYGLGKDADDRSRIQALVSSGSKAAEVTDLAGRGVGLAAVFKTVEQLDGNLAVRSRRGEGTEFEAVVPVRGWVGVRHSLPPPH